MRTNLFSVVLWLSALRWVGQPVAFDEQDAEVVERCMLAFPPTIKA